MRPVARLEPPLTVDPLALLTDVVAHMQQQFAAEVDCYDLERGGGLTVDLRIRAGNAVGRRFRLSATTGNGAGG